MHFNCSNRHANFFFFPTGMVPSRKTHTEAAKPAQVTNIYINTSINEQKAYMLKLNVVCFLPPLSVGVSVGCGVGGGSL